MLLIIFAVWARRPASGIIKPHLRYRSASVDLSRPRIEGSRAMTEAVRRIETAETIFGLNAASRLISEAMAPWVQDLGLLVVSVETTRPAGAPPDWQPGALLRMPFTNRICRDGGVVCAQALAGLADAAMMIACAAAWNGYRAMTTIDQTMHFLRPVNFDVLAEARIVRIGRTTSFGQINLYGAADRRHVGMASSAHAML
jgi:uncharacterized protein (TIGR00369 family)